MTTQDQKPRSVTVYTTADTHAHDHANTNANTNNTNAIMSTNDNVNGTGMNSNIVHNANTNANTNAHTNAHTSANTNNAVVDSPIIVIPPPAAWYQQDDDNNDNNSNNDSNNYNTSNTNTNTNSTNGISPINNGNDHYEQNQYQQQQQDQLSPFSEEDYSPNINQQSHPHDKYYIPNLNGDGTNDDGTNDDDTNDDNNNDNNNTSSHSSHNDNVEDVDNCHNDDDNDDDFHNSNSHYEHNNTKQQSSQHQQQQQQQQRQQRQQYDNIDYNNVINLKLKKDDHCNNYCISTATVTATPSSSCLAAASTSSSVYTSQSQSVYTSQSQSVVPSISISKNKISTTTTQSSSSIFRQKLKKHHHYQTSTSPTTPPPTSSSSSSSSKQPTNSDILIQKFQTLTTNYIPNATHELLSTSTRNIFHYTRKSYNSSHLFGKLKYKYSELGSNVGGYDYERLSNFGICDERDGEVLWDMSHIRDKYYYQLNNYINDDQQLHQQHHHQQQQQHQHQRQHCHDTTVRNQKRYKSKQQQDYHVGKNNRRTNNGTTTTSTNTNTNTASNKKKKAPMGLGWEDEWDRQRIALPPFSSLNWVDRQLVKEWRTCNYMIPTSPTTTTAAKSITSTKSTNQNMQQFKNDSIITGEDNQQDNVNTAVSASVSNNNADNKNDNDKSSISSSPSSSAQNQNQKTIIKDECIQNSKDEAEFEQEDFEQARTFIPKPMPRPPWENANTCYACRKGFNSTRLRHHCRLCGRSYCHLHSKYTHRLPHLGYDPDVPERTCGQCKHYLDIQNLAERIAWRMARCRDYLVNPMELCPYFETGVDTVEDVAVRLSKAAIHMAKSIPLGAQATVAVETLDVLRKHGLKGVYGLILRKEFMAAADLLCKVTGINRKAWPLSVHELSAAIFYALTQHRGLRGADPEMEHRIHAFKIGQNDDDDDSTTASLYSVPSVEIIDEEKFLPSISCSDRLNRIRADDKEDDDSSNEPTAEPVCEPVSDSLLASLIFYAPVAMHFIYANTEVDMQLLAAQQGWRLIYAHLKQDVDGSQVADMPASALFVHIEQNIACFTIRGTATINDVVTDIRAMPVQFPDTDINGSDSQKSGKRSDIDEEDWTQVLKGQGLALCGMAGAAYNLFRENIEALLLFARQGYRLRLVGHSLGGGVAALLGALVRRELEQEVCCGHDGETEKRDKPKIDDLLRVYSYGSPACVDAKLSEYAKSYVTNCILHDDVIPRLTPTSIRALLKHLLFIRETWVKAHLHDDLMAITERAKTAWAPKLRNGFTLMSTRKPAKMYKKLKAKGSSLQKKISRCKETKASKKDVIEDIVDTEVSFDNQPGSNSNPIEEVEGLLYDGDCFYETEESPIEHSDEENEVIESEAMNDSLLNVNKDILEDIDDGSDSPAVLLEETPLPRMFIPGNIVHIYTHRGGYKLAQVPRAFRELRRISLAGNMLTDHMSKSYYEALLECKLIRRANIKLPKWTGFGEEATCSCCASRFTWASTSNSEAQEARDKHNCRSCGGLVCDPCSDNRIPVSDIGINIPSRVCDRCYHDMGAALTDSNALTRSFVEDDDEEEDEDSTYKETTEVLNTEDEDNTNEREWKSKRSDVVDELVLGMPSATVSG